MGAVVPFPRSRHRPFVTKHAAHVACMSDRAGERYLAQQLKVQRETMSRRGIPAEVIDAEVRALESAIRAQIWRLVLTPGGAA